MRFCSAQTSHAIAHAAARKNSDANHTKRDSDMVGSIKTASQGKTIEGSIKQ